MAQAQTFRGLLIALAIAWAIYCFFLALYGPGGLLHLWATKSIVGLFGLFAGIMAIRRRWQPWVLAGASLYLAVHALIWWAFQYQTSSNDEGFLSAVGSTIVTRWQIAKYFASTEQMLEAARMFYEGLLMPPLQLCAALLSLGLWRTMPSNTTVETDAQRAARGSL